MTKKIVLLLMLSVLLSASELRSLYRSGDYQKCYNNAHNLLKKDNLNENTNFYLGMCSYSLGKYKESIEMFEKLLIIDENNQRARLELAKSYLVLKAFEVAKIELQNVLDSHPPKNVEKNVKKFLNYIDSQSKQNSYSLMLTLTSGYDTNINTSATKESLESLYPGSTSAGEIKSYFTNEMLSSYHTYTPRDKENFIWQNSFVVVNQNNLGSDSSVHKSDYNYLYTKLTTSPSFVKKSSKLSPNLFLSYLKYGGKNLLYTVGLKPDFTYVIDKTKMINLATQYYQKNYYKSSDFGKELNHYDISIAGSYINENQTFYGKLMKVWEKKLKSSNESFINRDGWGLDLGYNLSYGLWSGGVGVGYTSYNYDDIISGTSTQRDDIVKSIHGNINKSINKNLTVGLTLSSQKNNTNYIPSEYKKVTVGIVISYKIKGLF